jgi:hypothetical protein
MLEHQVMRTTVTLDSDVQRRIRTLMRTEKLTFKEALNRAVRTGVDALIAVKPKRKPFRTVPENMGIYSHLNYDNIGDLLDIADRANAAR